VTESLILNRLLRNLPGYTPEWSPAEPTAAYTLMQAYAHLAGIVEQRLRQVPERDELACFDMLGLHLLPASAARAPLVFSMAPDSPEDVTLPAGCQVAATPQATVPTLGAAAPPAPDPIIFATESTITLTPGQLKTLYCIDPGADQYADYSQQLTTGLTLFGDLEPAPHHLYLGHDTLFALGGSMSLLVAFVLQQPARSSLSLVWDYYTDAGWIPLPFRAEDDTTAGLTEDGQMTLHRDCGPNAKKTTVGPIESYWIRARLATPLISAALAPLPLIEDIAVRIGVSKDGLSPDAAFADGIALDVSKDFLPFGPIPALSSTFYLSCADAFSRAGASVTIAFKLSRPGVKQDSLAISWDYSTDSGWTSFSGMALYQFDADGSFALTCPADWAEVDVNGNKQRWMRARIASGDFGRPPYVTGVKGQQPTFGGGNLVPPIVKTVAVSFQHLTDAQRLDHCVTYNDFIYTDVSEAARWPGQQFMPFVPVSDRTPAVHFGFDHTLPDGLGSLFVHLAGLSGALESTSPFVWEYLTAGGWRELPVRDETHGFQTSGMLQFIGPRDAVLADGLGGQRYWIRARLKAGESTPSASVTGIWVNAVWAAQRSRSDRELAGRSDGNPGQSFRLTHQPILKGELVEVQEWTGRGDAWRGVLRGVPASDIRLDTDPATGEAIAAWVRWQLRDNFYSSQPQDRHYVLERATGLLKFGAHVPAAGKRIVVSYSFGGGLGGNVAAGAVSQLRTAAPYVVGAKNVIAAQGGADMEDVGDLRLRGPQHVRHRNRGISAQDLEWIALEASPEVARVHCMPLTGPDGRAQRGWVTLLVVPNALDPQPALTDELVQEVQSYVAACVPPGMRIRVTGPQYTLVSIRSIVIPAEADNAAIVEANVRAALNTFLHPLHGGRDGRGWNFGEPVRLSHVAAIIEGVDGVEHAESTELQADGVLGGMSLTIPRDRLVAAGPHELVLRIGAA
jgi:hypothetical protein